LHRRERREKRGVIHWITPLFSLLLAHATNHHVILSAEGAKDLLRRLGCGRRKSLRALRVDSEFGA